MKAMTTTAPSPPATEVPQAAAPLLVTFDTSPERYRHWRLDVDGPVATLTLDVDEEGGLVPGYELKLNSYDLGVDIELHDAVQRLRFEHPEVGAVVVTSGKDKVFSAGANIRMLAASSHAWKVNFCKFTNETRHAVEDATENSGQRYIAAVNGTASGGGYELALACDHIVLVDDRNSAVSLPEVPLLGVLPGTGGLTRLVDKRKVRRDLADVVSTTAEGVKGARAVEWNLVDEVAPRTTFSDVVRRRALEAAEASPRPRDARGIALLPLEREVTADSIVEPLVRADLDREAGTVTITVAGPTEAPPADAEGVVAQGADFWPLAAARQLDDVLLLLRTNELELGTFVLRTVGDPDLVVAHDRLLAEAAGHWLVNEVRLLWKRTLKRVDTTSRSLVALVEPGSCFAGTLAELALAADRSFMLDASGADPSDLAGPPPALVLTATNFGPLPMGNGLTRLATRFLGAPERVEELAGLTGEALGTERAAELGLVTFTPDDLDWDDEVRLTLEERASFSPDALTGMEANLRFAGPETAETKVFGRLTAWQNWIFQRPNAVGEEGALRRYGTGARASFDRKRV